MRGNERFERCMVDIKRASLTEQRPPVSVPSRWGWSPPKPPAMANDSYRDRRGGSPCVTRREAGFCCLPGQRLTGSGKQGEARASPTQEASGQIMGLYLWIAIGSAIGGVARYWCSGVAARLIGETFPWGTLIVNVVGSFIIGFFATLTGPDGRIFVGTTARQFVMVGLCGGYTTFSSFSLQTLNLVSDGEWVQASFNIVGSVVMCLLAVWRGHIAAFSLNTMRWV